LSLGAAPRWKSARNSVPRPAGSFGSKFELEAWLVFEVGKTLLKLMAMWLTYRFLLPVCARGLRLSRKTVVRLPGEHDQFRSRWESARSSLLEFPSRHHDGAGLASIVSGSPVVLK
jgi:hypothetical protein